MSTLASSRPQTERVGARPDASGQLDAVIKTLNAIAHRHGATTEGYTFFAALHKLALHGMGVGGGAEVSQSGEIAALVSIVRRLSLESSIVVLDVGANIGSYARMVLAHVPNVILHAFEPSPNSFEKLRAAANDPRCTCHPIGLSDQETETELFSNAAGSAIASVHKRRLDHFGIRFDQSERISLRRLDGFCDERGIERIHFLKLDVEGHEIAVLRGAAQMLAAGRIDAIQFEFGGTNIDSRTYFQDFWYLLKDYSIHRILRNGLARIEAYGETEEMFLTQNFLAIRRALQPA